MNIVAYLNESSNIRLLVLYKEGKHKGMAYTQCWYQNESSNIRPSVLYIGLGDSGLTGMAYTKWCNQNELGYRYQLCAAHRVWGTREWHIQYTVLESESQLPRHITPYTNFTGLIRLTTTSDQFHYTSGGSQSAPPPKSRREGDDIGYSGGIY